MNALKLPLTIAALAAGGAIMLCPVSAAEPVVSAPPGEGWLELAVGGNEDAPSRHFNRATHTCHSGQRRS